MAERDIVVRPACARDFASPQLVRGIGVTVQEMDDERFGAGREQQFDGARDLGFVERLVHGAAGRHAFADFEPALARYQRLECAGHAVSIGTGATAELKAVAKSARGDQANLGDLALEHSVGRCRRAMDDQVEISRRNAGGVDGRQHALGLIAGRCRNFRDPDMGFGAGLLKDQEIGERPADVDAGNTPGYRVHIGSVPGQGCPASRSFACK